MVCTLYHYAKFGWNRRRSSFDNMNVFRFREFGLKTPIHALKLGFCGFDTLNGELCEKTQKGTPLCESESFEPSCVKIRRRV